MFDSWWSLDSYRDFKGNPVQTLVVFGHLSGFQQQSCPNSGRLRTAIVISKAILSKHWSSSDTFRDFNGNPVRTSVAFGLHS